MAARQKKPAYPFSQGANSLSSNARPSPGPSRLGPGNPPSGVRQQPPPVAQQQYPIASGASNSSTANLLATESAKPRNVSSTTINTQNTGSLEGYSDKFSLSADPTSWGTDLTMNNAEADDYLHNPDPRRDRKNDQGGTIFTARGIANLGFLLILGLGLVTLFAGYPIISHFTSKNLSKNGAYGIGGVNASGQVPQISGHFVLIDPDTPKTAYTYTANVDKSTWDLVFSDEFNVPNRTFYPGDDAYWEAVNLHYWPTADLEWYSPDSITTAQGALQITLTEEETYNLSYKSGHMTSWNKFCFSGGYIEANVSLPGNPAYGGLWPAIWMMGNLGRAGYGATTDGMWPYSYDECDWGTLPNQTFGDKPAAAFTQGDQYYDGHLSFLSGQRLSRCTCKGDPNHPGPQRSDGTFYGRSAPEIDMFEAITSPQGLGQVSQSCQFAPFNAEYAWKNGTGDVLIYDNTTTQLNAYRGSVYQEAVSALSFTNQDAYQINNKFTTYGIEYEAGDNGYITWFNDGKPMWTVYPSAVAADPVANISARIIPAEPMYIIMNLGISNSFGKISPDLTFPSVMQVDYVRVYQNPNSRNIGCSPEMYPTEDYINDYLEAFTNPNLTTFSGGIYGSFNQTLPKNSLVDQC